MKYIAKYKFPWLLCMLFSIALLASCSKEERGGGIGSAGNRNPPITLTAGESYTLSTAMQFDYPADTAVTWTCEPLGVVSMDSINTVVSFDTIPVIDPGNYKINGWDTTGITITASVKITAETASQTAITVKIGTAGPRTWQIHIRAGNSGGLTEDEGVVFNGITWATRNVNTPGYFVAEPKDYGLYYQWNSSTGWSVTGARNGWDDSWNGNESIAWEEVNTPCPAGWRIPTDRELNDLAKVNNRWETRKDTINGKPVDVNGRAFGDEPNILFLPAAGYLSREGTYYEDNLGGFYWGSRIYSDSYPYCFSFGNDVPKVGDNFHYVGFSCRCVKDTDGSTE
ncbi:MAG: hypothetical protein LBR52_03475 [Prevotellaceae bacterium]|jgi:uncharacterized protein (TIGR02145 family)|nr:hypothetical protein [Prevotellaceae bacterium]